MRGSILLRQRVYPFTAKRVGRELVFRFSVPVPGPHGPITTLALAARSGLAGALHALARLERNAQ